MTLLKRFRRPLTLTLIKTQAENVLFLHIWPDVFCCGPVFPSHSTVSAVCGHAVCFCSHENEICCINKVCAASYSLYGGKNQPEKVLYELQNIALIYFFFYFFILLKCNVFVHVFCFLFCFHCSKCLFMVDNDATFCLSLFLLWSFF